MNLKLVFRIFAGFGAFFALMSLLATDAMMESYGMELSSDSSLLIQFMVMVQLMFAIVVWQLPSWLGENLAKAGPTLMVVSLMPVAMNIFHVDRLQWPKLWSPESGWFSPRCSISTAKNLNKEEKEIESVAICIVTGINSLRT